jgi:hypothetical protein
MVKKFGFRRPARMAGLSPDEIAELQQRARARKDALVASKLQALAGLWGVSVEAAAARVEVNKSRYIGDQE